MLPPSIRRVPAGQIRRLFNTSAVPAMIANGILTAQYLRDAVLRNPAAVGEPPGTRSQIIRYADATGRWIVEVHQYLRPDGTLGASGRPDPKRLRLAGIIYVAQ
jgi:hypothetical protein